MLTVTEQQNHTPPPLQAQEALSAKEHPLRVGFTAVPSAPPRPFSQTSEMTMLMSDYLCQLSLSEFLSPHLGT